MTAAAYHNPVYNLTELSYVTMETEVIVVGAGPTGLMLAAELALAGVSAVLVEKLPRRSALSRAGGLQPRSVEVLELRGLLEPILERGLGRPAAHGGHFAALPVPLTFGGWGTRHPYVLSIPQERLEAFFEERVAEAGVPVLRGTTVTGVAQDPEGVSATAAGPHGELRLGGRYLAACDGAHSTVRKLLGVGFPGRAGTMSAVLADVALAAAGGGVPLESAHFSQLLRRSGERWTVLSPLGDGLHRFVFGGPEQQALDREAEVTHDEVARALRDSYGPDAELAEVRHASRFSDATRQVERYRCGRVLLAGDAAHIHSPMGGQGANLGLQDAFNLGWKLAAEVRGRAPDGLLDTYHAERHPVGARVLESTRAQNALNRREDEEVADLRTILTDLLRVPEANARLSGLVGGLDIRYEMPGAPPHPLLGWRAPDLDLGARGRVSHLLRAGRGLLLELRERPALGEVAAGWASRVDHVAAPAAEPVDAAAMLVRPDGHVCWVAGAGAAGLHDALLRWFGDTSG
jgi:2-polyprenyl-6-methoxyphenol hydroxylase-like FAD-dependent oxidoreductase